MAKPVRDYSQHHEQILIEMVFGKKSKGWAVDVGACDGVSISNTKWLEEIGWEVLCIEPNPHYVKQLKANRKRSLAVACGKTNLDAQKFSIYEVEKNNFEAYSCLDTKAKTPAASPAVGPTIGPGLVALKKKMRPAKKIKVDVRTLDWCLEKAKFPRLDMVSIDVEGTEQDVLDGFDINRWAPRMVIIEDWIGGRYRSWFARRGYYVMRRLEVNEILLRCDP